MSNFFFFKQKTAYEVLTCDWSSDVCSSDLGWNNRYILKTELQGRLFHGPHPRPALWQARDARDRKSVV